MTDAFRFPAEWEPQSAVLIAWPHAATDWAERLGDVEETYVALVAAITRFQSVVICVADTDLQTYAEARLRYLIENFPQSEEAPLAKERLSSIPGR